VSSTRRLSFRFFSEVLGTAGSASARPDREGVVGLVQLRAQHSCHSGSPPPRQNETVLGATEIVGVAHNHDPPATAALQQLSQLGEPPPYARTQPGAVLGNSTSELNRTLTCFSPSSTRAAPRRSLVGTTTSRTGARMFRIGAPLEDGDNWSDHRRPHPGAAGG
jgi:hypothetical protein